MMPACILLTTSLIAAPQSPATAPAPATATTSQCSQALAGGVSGGGAEICLAEEALRLANAAPKGSAERSHLYQDAAEHYRRGASAASDLDVKTRALNSLADVFDTPQLNEPDRMEGVLRELIALQPQALAPVFRLAKLQEDRGLIDAAENTLLAARHQNPDAVDPYKMLAQFYARRATAMHGTVQSQKAPQVAATPGQADDNGVYQVGGAIAPPQRLDRAVYPAEALAAGIQGAVAAEVVLNPSGDVVDAKVVRSVPLLDEEAIRTVRNWHFAPTVVNGQAVPVRMTVTVTFTTR